MSPYLALLCAHAYASDGAVVLFKDTGVVLRGNTTQRVFKELPSGEEVDRQ